MPRRSKAMALPAPLRRRLDALLVERGFSDYAALADWLADQGHPMSHAAVHRYGSRLERRIEHVKLATEQAEALVAAAPDDAGAVADASIRVAQQRIFDVLLASEGGDLKELSRAAAALADTARAGTAVRAERRKALERAAEAAGAEAKRHGVSPETAAAIRAAIEGAGP